MKIGLLEDNPTILDLMQIVLKLAGHTASTHIYGQSLLDALFERHNTEYPLHRCLPYDLLIVDLNLPGELSGLEVITSIYRLLTPDMLPIIVVSAGSLNELAQLHQQFPSIPVVRKPFTIQSLLQTISSLHPVALP